MGLMYLYHRLGVPAEIVHINYGKRGRESDLDAELTEQMAFQWGFTCHSLSVDASEAGGENFQQWARDTRYRIFRDLKKELGAACITTAHHEDDQVETILQRGVRGDERVPGDGLGLDLVRRLVEDAYGGEVRLADVSPAGLRVSVTLPGRIGPEPQRG